MLALLIRAAAKYFSIIPSTQSLRKRVGDQAAVVLHKRSAIKTRISDAEVIEIAKCQDKSTQDRG